MKLPPFGRGLSAVADNLPHFGRGLSAVADNLPSIRHLLHPNDTPFTFFVGSSLWLLTFASFGITGYVFIKGTFSFMSSP